MPGLQCDLPNLILESMPPDPDLADLIEQASIEGQIDSQNAQLADVWMMSEPLSLTTLAVANSH